MEFKSRSNQPQPARPAQPAARPSYEENNNNGVSHMNNVSGPNKRKLMITVIVIVLVVLLLAAGGMFLKSKLSGAERDIKGDKFQALFLTNGQVYFGHLSHIDSGYARMSDIYYLQVQQSVQPADKKDDKQPQVSLTKLGGELHGPEDAMYISRDQVLFWENLKDDGKVAQAIKEHQKK